MAPLTFADCKIIWDPSLENDKVAGVQINDLVVSPIEMADAYMLIEMYCSEQVWSRVCTFVQYESRAFPDIVKAAKMQAIFHVEFLQNEEWNVGNEEALYDEAMLQLLSRLS
jgi:hypothetical protein